MLTTSFADPLIGVLLDGRYRISQKLARGGMATVYRAEDLRLSRVVAIKVMHEGLGEDGDFTSKFDREARAAAKLCHPNVVSVFDQGADAGRPYIVMEYVAGCTLRNLIARDAPLEPERALELIDHILSALCAAHENGLVHRDIKPENVLLSDRGHLKVADFGLARAVSSQTATATQGVLIGTVSYLPPELVLHGKADTRSDIYSTGVVLFELLTSTKPYTGETPIQVAYAHVHNRVPAPSSRLETSWQTSRSAIPPYVDALVLAATQREPDRRPADARAFQAMVRKAQEALSAGVMDDPALTAEFSRAFAVDEDTELHGPLDDFLDAPPFDYEPAAPAPVTSARSARSPRSPQSASPRSPQSASPAPVRRESPSRASALPPAVAVRRRRLLAGIALVLVTLLGTGSWWMLDGRYVATPALVGIAQADAERLAEENGLSVRADQAFSETVPAGQVISTDPTAGTDIRRGGSLAAVVSKGPERFEMPRVVGMSRDDADAALSASNLVIGTVKEDWHEEIDAGMVSAASAEPGTRLKRGEPIDLTLSKGPKPIRIPNQAGKSARDAQANLENLGFAVVMKTANSPTVAEGLIISQQPADGVGHRGDTITLVRSLGPAMVAVPDVKAKPVQEATDLLTQAGFKVATQPGDNPLGLGYVQRTDPAGAAQAPEGSTITLFVI
ncbi:Stk1 family PASTA domain-containing Ser/Thr kinase [Ammonicoccus fulvus]|uniref:non-specific serine/threonine protein kinase n=1 Tax=Ammonicoccus fulvus TaxID=3138240 RepID=A0ABZ3FQH9_9ACTN